MQTREGNTRGVVKDKAKDARIVRSAGVVSLGTLLSRVAGLVRLQVIAYLFGYSPATDAFWLAFSIPNMLRALLAEGSLSTSFIPVLTTCRTEQGEEESWRMVSAVLTTIILVGVLVVGMGIALAPWYVPYLALGFRHSPAQLALTVLLTRIMWPFLLCMSIGAIAMGVLNCHGRFAWPAFAPLFFNVALIAAGIALTPVFGIYSLAVGVVSGGGVQLAVQLPALRATGFRYRLLLQWSNAYVRKVFRLFLPATLGSFSLQISVLITRVFASTLPPGSISGLQYAMRLLQFPLGLFPLALSTALFPRFSQLAATQDQHELMRTMRTGILMVAFLLIPSSIGLLVLREPLIAVLFQHGVFSVDDTVLTSQALLAYIPSLLATGIVMVVSRVFYALHDMRTPLMGAILAVVVNIALNFALVSPLRHQGLALATSISAIANMVFLLAALTRRQGSIGGLYLAKRMLRTILCSVVMGVVVWGVHRATQQCIPSCSLAASIVSLALSILSGVGVIALLAYLMHMEEFALVESSLRRQNRR
jgi:putative peptidoglycan lipid II flippase